MSWALAPSHGRNPRPLGRGGCQDGYWNYAFANAGTYIIGVGKYYDSVIPEGMSYTLNISTVAAVPEPETYALLGIGLLGMFAAQRRKRMA